MKSLINKLAWVGGSVFWMTSAASELPSMCFDGTSAGGTECELTINGEPVDTGMAPDDFFMPQNELANELNALYGDLHRESKLNDVDQQ